MRGADFLSGVSMAAFAASGVFFLKFWRASRDRFYLLFCIACWFLSLERLAILWATGLLEPLPTDATEMSVWVYMFRLSAFVCILVAVVHKNRVGGKAD